MGYNVFGYRIGTAGPCKVGDDCNGAGTHEQSGTKVAEVPDAVILQGPAPYALYLLRVWQGTVVLMKMTVELQQSAEVLLYEYTNAQVNSTCAKKSGQISGQLHIRDKPLSQADNIIPAVTFTFVEFQDLLIGSTHDDIQFRAAHGNKKLFELFHQPGAISLALIRR